MNYYDQVEPPFATMDDAHREWHSNTGVPMGQPGCPQDACHPPDEYDDSDYVDSSMTPAGPAPEEGIMSNEVKSNEVKYPDVTVQLTGTDGNAFSIIGRVRRALRRAGVSNDELEAFTKEATSGDYDNVLATAMRWVEVE